MMGSETIFCRGEAGKFSRLACPGLRTGGVYGNIFRGSIGGKEAGERI